MIKLALIQLDIAWEEPATNLGRAQAFAAQAAKDNCHMMVLPETFSTGFSANVPAILEAPDGPTVQGLTQMARTNHIAIAAGYAEASADGKARNMAIVMDREAHVLAKYAKCYPFSLVGEDKYMEAGTETVVFDINGISASIFVCYDLRFPELFRKVAKQVQLMFVIANWPASRMQYWEALLKARAIENLCYVVGVDRIGQDGNGIAYAGGSLVFDPLGNEIARGGKDQEYLTVELDPEEVQRVRERYPFLEDIKPI